MTQVNQPPRCPVRGVRQRDARRGADGRCRPSRGRIRYRIRRTRMGRSSLAHARSAVRTSAGSLRTVNARQHRPPSERFLPPPSDRIAPASSASFSKTGSMVTPAAASSPLTRRTSTPTSTSFPITDQLPDHLSEIGRPGTLNRALRRPDQRQAHRVRGRGRPRRPGLSFGPRCRPAALGQQLVNQRALLGYLRRQSTEFGHGVLLPFEHDPPPLDAEMQLVTGGKSERGADLGRNDKTTLLTKDERGIHMTIVPLGPSLCQGS